MASFSSVRHHRGHMQATWTESIWIAKNGLSLSNLCTAFQWNILPGDSQPNEIETPLRP